MSALRGVRVLVTRAEGQAESLARELAARGAEVRTLPLIELAPPSSWEPADRAIESLDRYDAVVLTSVNAVARFWDRVQARVGACDLPALPAGVRVLAVGPKTARALRERGVSVDAVPEKHRAAALEAELVRLLGPLSALRVLLPRAEAGREELPERVRAAGGTIDVVSVYRTVMPDGAANALRELLATWRPQVITLASGSAAENLAAAAGDDASATAALREVRFAAIGPVTAARVRELGLGEPIVATQPAMETLAEALQAALGRRRH